MPRNRPAGLPSRKQILDFITSSDPGRQARDRAGVRAVGPGQDRAQGLLKDMADEGLIDSSPGRAFHKMGGVPKVTVLRIVEVDDSGQCLGGARSTGKRRPPRRAPHPGARQAVGARHRRPRSCPHRSSGRGLDRASDEEARQVSRAGAGRASAAKASASWLSPVDKRERREFAISDLNDAEAGDLVLCEVTGRPPRVTARVDAVLGDPFAPRSFSLIAIHKHGLRARVRAGRDRRGGPSVEAAAGRTRGPHATCRSSRSTPQDARDHDDAIWAGGGRGRAAGTRSSPSPTSASTSAPAPSSTARRGRAATASTSPTASCRCSPKSCLPTSARSRKAPTAPRWPATSGSTRTASSRAGASPARRSASPRTSPTRTRRRRWTRRTKSAWT